MTADDAMLQRLVRQMNRYPNGGVRVIFEDWPCCRPFLRITVQLVNGTKVTELTTN